MFIYFNTLIPGCSFIVQAMYTVCYTIFRIFHGLGWTVKAYSIILVESGKREHTRTSRSWP